MDRELNVHMSFYLLMKADETRADAENRFYEIMKSLENSDILHESSIQVYDISVQEV